MGAAAREPSMEDILSSIKRIIAEDGEAPAPRPSRAKGAAVAAAPAPEEADHDDRVLELTQELRSEEPAVAPLAAPLPPPPSRDSVVSDEAAVAARASLSHLSALLVRPADGESPTLEGLVREMLRPMLKTWLDEHLPDIVEAQVAREIARITGRTL
jgi:hypothetical protein